MVTTCYFNGENKMAVIKSQHLVAVYGSLRKGMSNHRLNENAGAVHLFDGLTYENYDMHAYCPGGYPSVNLTGTQSGKPVKVEIYQVEYQGLLNSYDHLEGYSVANPENSFYNRTMVPIVLSPTGDMVMAWIYHIDEDNGDLVEDGDWVKYMGVSA